MSADLFRMDGRTVIVTGAGGALGRAMAVGLVEAGASVALDDVHGGRLGQTVDAVRAAGGTCIAVEGDAADPAHIEAFVTETERTYGRIDALVNNAGINPQQSQPEDFPMAVWEEVMRVNLAGYMRFAQAVGRRMIAAGKGGSIVNISSIAAASTLGRGNLAFGVSKAGVDQLTRNLAVEWAGFGIRVNSILPCQFVNEGLMAQIRDPARAAIVARMISGIPMGRMGRPEEIVGPVLFLLSDAASMVTGVNLPVDGGNLALNPGGSVPTY
jgi:NAD(P)-dependent dehydrogenase (short-subunit alcohol dehydrogenase family)